MKTPDKHRSPTYGETFGPMDRRPIPPHRSGGGMRPPELPVPDGATMTDKQKIDEIRALITATPVYPAQEKPWRLEPHLMRHRMAMTAEGLHSKSDIADQFAIRDIAIHTLLSALDERERERKYLEEHHVITASAIGLAKLALQEGRIDKAHHALVRACNQIDEITRRYCPLTAAIAATTPQGIQLDEISQAASDRLTALAGQKEAG